MTKLHEIGGTSPTNDAKKIIEIGLPYAVKFVIQGTADYLFHRWSNEAVAEKAKSSKGSKGKKSDDVESYVYRNDDKILCIPSEQMRMSIITAAKYKQDPRSPRKSSMDLYKAAIIPLMDLAPLGKKEWDYLDMRRVVIQRNSITRSRPAMKKGWSVEFMFMINLPEYIAPDDFHDTICMAGRLNGIGDFRPTFGRFQVVKFEVL